MTNQFLNELLEIHPHLREEYNTKQYQYSLEIIEYMMNNQIEPNKMANIIGVSNEVYYRMESGDNSLDINEYEDALQKLRTYPKYK